MSFPVGAVRLFRTPALPRPERPRPCPRFLLLWYLRAFPIAVQDRLIRLEEELRMQRLLPPALQSRLGEFTAAQMIALRFASDAELPELASKVLNERITDRKQIKLLIRDWRADHMRA